jgi:hypothetical protein
MTARAKPWLSLLILGACIALVVVLAQVRRMDQNRPHAHLTSSVPLSQAPHEPRPVTLMMPDDKTGALDPVKQTLVLPADESTRARALVELLIDSWRAPHSPHPVQSSAGVDSVFLMPVPNQPGHQLAVVNFDAAFPHSQPSGIEPETLTLLSIIQTLHENIPSVTEVRFLVNGQTRATLAGHASLMRTYLANTTVPEPKS